MPDRSYSNLEGISDGIDASNVFIEAIDEKTTDERKNKLEKQLLEYCKYDTEAMVLIVNYLTAN